MARGKSRSGGGHRLYAQAAGGRAHKEPFDAVWGQRRAQLRHPDGNPADLYASLEGTR